MGWAAWATFGDRGYRVYGWGTGTEGFGVVRMRGATYVMSGLETTSRGWLMEEIGRLHPNNYARHWRSHGAVVWRLPDGVVVFGFVAVWVGWLAWLERRERRAMLSNRVED